jgi:protein SCO1
MSRRPTTIAAAAALALTLGGLVVGPALADAVGVEVAPGSTEHRDGHAGGDHGRPGDHHESLAPTEMSDASLFHLDVGWTDQHGAPVRLADFAGRPLMITMFYGNCTTACPLLLHKARLLQDALPEPLPVLAVSFDPATDTPEAMRAYAAQRGFDREAWHFLAGAPSSIRMLATLLGVQYQRRADGHFNHSNLIALLDAHGVVRLRTEGVAPDVDDVVRAVATGALEH